MSDPVPNPIIFYCRDCKKIVDAVKKGSKYEYTCPVCKSERVVFGSQKAICDFFQVVAPKVQVTS